MSFLTINNLNKSYGDIKALSDVNIEIKKGEFFALLGPSGCGKTTTMRCVAGFEDITSGEIYIDNQIVNNIPANKRNCGMVFQSYALFPHMTVFDNIAYSLHVERFNQGGIGKKSAIILHLLNNKIGKVPPYVREKVEEVLKFVELDNFSNRFPNQLSGGQQQRVALARCLIMEPSVLLMDEPLSNLDKNLRGTMRDTIRDIQQKIGITTIFVTHDQEEAMSMADRVAVMFEGRVEQIDKPTELYRNPASNRIAKFVGSSNIIDGVVKESKPNKKTIIQIDENSFIASSQTTTKKEVQLLIRPESIAIKRKGVGNSESEVLEGIITLVTYLGATIRYNITVGNVKLHADSVFDTLLSEGTIVNLQIDPQKVKIL